MEYLDLKGLINPADAAAATERNDKKAYLSLGNPLQVWSTRVDTRMDINHTSSSFDPQNWPVREVLCYILLEGLS